jgi:xylulokinase
LKAVVEAIKDCFSQGSYGNKIAGVSISGLVGVMLPIDKEGKPVRPAMIWMDSRSEEECTDIRNSIGEEKINQINGNRVAPWFVEPKALWMKKHEPENYEKTYCSYLIVCCDRFRGVFRCVRGINKRKW